jgi:hypothetical protein
MKTKAYGAWSHFGDRRCGKSLASQCFAKSPQFVRNATFQPYLQPGANPALSRGCPGRVVTPGAERGALHVLIGDRFPRRDDAGVDLPRPSRARTKKRDFPEKKVLRLNRRTRIDFRIEAGTDIPRRPAGHSHSYRPRRAVNGSIGLHSCVRIS